MKQTFTRLLFGSLSLISTLALISCNRTPDLTKDEIYKVLNEIIADDSLRLYTVCWQFDNLPILNDYGFSDKDKKFIDKQKAAFKNFKLEPDRLKSYSRKKRMFDFIDIDTTCNAGIINRLSFPLISVDRQRVVIENTEDCHCMLGGQGSTNLYVKQNGHWTREKSFDQWISQTNITDPECDISTAGNMRFGVIAGRRISHQHLFTISFSSGGCFSISHYRQYMFVVGNIK